jgi:hypothetical protein
MPAGWGKGQQRLQHPKSKLEMTGSWVNGPTFCTGDFYPPWYNLFQFGFF